MMRCSTLQGNLLLLTALLSTLPAYREVQLQKQYVPTMKGDKIIAYKTAYFGQVHAGGKPFSVVFDTGSGHFILPSTSCTSAVCKQKQRYNQNESATAIDIDADGTVVTADAPERDQLTIAFGLGEVVGEFVQERVCLGALGGESADGTPCVDLRVVVALEMTEDPFGLFHFDGVLGLGLNALTLDPQFSFFSQMTQQHPTLHTQFAVFLARFDGGESVISFGGYNESRMTSEINWSPVAKTHLGYWQVNIKRVLLGAEVFADCEDGGCHAVLDTGTSLLGVPRRMLRTMHRTLTRPISASSGDNVDSIDCRTMPGLQIHFDLGDHMVTLGPEDYSRPTPFNISGKGGDSDSFAAWKLFCRSLLLPVDMAAPIGPKLFLWGEPVLRRYHTVYDAAKQRIGFSKARDDVPETEGLPVLGTPPPGSQVSGIGAPRRQHTSAGDSGKGASSDGERATAHTLIT